MGSRQLKIDYRRGSARSADAARGSAKVSEASRSILWPSNLFSALKITLQVLNHRLTLIG